jgi:hypothetical protein
MLAVMWAKSHPGTPVVNIDGHGRRTVSQYEGLSEGDARSRIAEAEARVKASLGALSGPLPQPMADGLMAQQRALPSQFRAPEDMFVGSIERTLRWESILAPVARRIGSRDTRCCGELRHVWALPQST